MGASGTIRRTAVAVGAAALSLLAGEAALRLLPTGLLVDLDIYRETDSMLLLRPGLKRRHVTPLWDVEIRTNSEGFRDFERPPAPGEAFVLGLGDSFAFGWGVELEQTLYSRMEASAGVRVIKAGIPGTGTSDQARLLARTLERRRPSAVALLFFVGNDFADVHHGGSAQHSVMNGFLTRPAPPDTSAGKLKRLAIHSRVLHLLRLASFRLGAAPPPRFWDDRMREYAEVHLRNPPPRARNAIDATLGALDDIAGQCERAGAPLLLIVLPRSYQVYEGEIEGVLQELDWNRAMLDLDRPQRLLGDWAHNRGVAAVDLLPAFRAHAAGGGEPLYFTPDAHMTAAGHGLAADVSLPTLRELLRGRSP